MATYIIIFIYSNPILDNSSKGTSEQGQPEQYPVAAQFFKQKPRGVDNNRPLFIHTSLHHTLHTHLDSLLWLCCLAEINGLLSLAWPDTVLLQSQKEVCQCVHSFKYTSSRFSVQTSKKWKNPLMRRAGNKESQRLKLGERKENGNSFPYTWFPRPFSFLSYLASRIRAESLRCPCVQRSVWILKRETPLTTGLCWLSLMFLVGQNLQLDITWSKHVHHLCGMQLCDGAGGITWQSREFLKVLKVQNWKEEP